MGTNLGGSYPSLFGAEIFRAEVVSGLEVVEDGELGDVVEDDHGGEDEEADEGDLIDALLDLLVEVAAHGGLDEEEEDHAAVEDGDGEQVEDAEVEGDVGHEADEGHPAGHLDSLVDLGSDADGAGEGAHGDLTGEHALEDFDDEERAFFVELPGGDEGFAEGQALNLDGREDGLEADAVELDAVACVGELRGEQYGEGVAVALDGEACGLSCAILEVGQEGFDGVQLEAVDGDDLVFGLEAGAGGGGVGVAGVEGFDLDGGVLHPGDEAEFVEGKVVGSAFGFDKDFGVGALSVVEEGEGDGLVDIEEGADGYVIPGGIFNGVVVDDEVAGADAGGGCWGVGGDVVGECGAIDILLDLVVEHGDSGHEGDGEEEVGEGSCEGDGDALPAGMRVELAGISGGFFAGVVACHFDVSAEGEEG